MELDPIQGVLSFGPRIATLCSSSIDRALPRSPKVGSGWALLRPRRRQFVDFAGVRVLRLGPVAGSGLGVTPGETYWRCGLSLSAGLVPERDKRAEVGGGEARLNELDLVRISVPCVEMGRRLRRDLLRLSSWACRVKVILEAGQTGARTSSAIARGGLMYDRGRLSQ